MTEADVGAVGVVHDTAFVKHGVTSLTVGVTAVSDVLKIVLYLRYCLLSNGAPVTAVKSAGLVVKNVEAVPSGPMKVNGPEELVLAAAWNCTFVLAGFTAVQDKLVHLGV